MCCFVSKLAWVLEDSLCGWRRAERVETLSSTEQAVLVFGARADQAEKDLEASQSRAKKAKRDAESLTDALSAEREKAAYLQNEVVSLRVDKDTLCQGHIEAERVVTRYEEEISALKKRDELHQLQLEEEHTK
ncbi:hypothetical protein Droror1_Dr00017765 [Drosera rotundifolia]